MTTEIKACDGGCDGAVDVRILPLPGGNLHLCRTCFNREILWRKDRNRQLATDCQFDIPQWGTLEKTP